MSLELPWKVEQRQRILGEFIQRPSQQVWWMVQWRFANGEIFPQYWIQANTADDALQKALVGRPLGGVTVDILDVLGHISGKGAVSKEGYWVTRDPPERSLVPKYQPKEIIWAEKKLTRFQVRLRFTALAMWTLGSFAGCQATIQRTPRSVRVSGRGGTYWRRPPGGKQADDRANRKTLWMRAIIFTGWAFSTFWLYDRAFYEREKDS